MSSNARRRRQYRVRTATGFIIYRGPSMIDGAPIVCVFLPHSTNGKTGDMCQTYIMRADLPPIGAARTGADKSACGGCPHRGRIVTGENGESKNVERSCYVTLFHGPRAVYDAFTRGKYADASGNLEAIERIGANQLIRLGTYGDPAAVPVEVWDALLLCAAGNTGYSHQWKAPRLRGVMKYCQASCDTVTDVEKARDLGFGTFYVAPSGATVDVDSAPFVGATLCPASAEAGKVATCAECLMCNGYGNVYIGAHGTGAKYVNARAARALPVL